MPGTNVELSTGGIYNNSDADITKDGQTEVKTQDQQLKENSVFYSKYDDNKNAKVEISDNSAKSFMAKGFNVQVDSSLDGNDILAQKTKAKLSVGYGAETLKNLYNSTMQTLFKAFHYSTESTDRADSESESNMNGQISQFNNTVKADYQRVIAEAQSEAKKEIADEKQKAQNEIQNAAKSDEGFSVTNTLNQKNGIEAADVKFSENEQGNQVITIKSKKTGNEFQYQRKDDGSYIEIDKKGNAIKDKKGDLKTYTLQDGQLVRNHSELTVDDNQFKKTPANTYRLPGDTGAQRYTINTSGNGPLEVQNFNPEKLDSTPVGGLSIDTSLSSVGEISIPDSVKRTQTESAIKAQGGKIIERDVNGEKQQIAVFKNEQGETVRQLIKDDGSTENIVEVSTSGKNKYRTKTEMNEDVAKALGVDIGNIPSDIKPEYKDGALVFKKDGKIMNQQQLKVYINNLHKQIELAEFKKSVTGT